MGFQKAGNVSADVPGGVSVGDRGGQAPVGEPEDAVGDGVGVGAVFDGGHGGLDESPDELAGQSGRVGAEGGDRGLEGGVVEVVESAELTILVHSQTWLARIQAAARTPLKVALLNPTTKRSSFLRVPPAQG